MIYTNDTELALNDDRCVILEILGDTDDAELDPSRLVHKLIAGHFGEADYDELLRAHKVREAQDERLYLEMVGAHRGPAFEEDEPL